MVTVFEFAPPSHLHEFSLFVPGVLKFADVEGANHSRVVRAIDDNECELEIRWSFFGSNPNSLVLGNLPVRIDMWMQILANNRTNMEGMQEGAQELRIRALETNAYAISREAP